ncbi:MAG TPA: GntR family transcriptional regulator [Acidimicrobiales bacterium]|jgi:GntR family transcriptional regulator|nr:GntR family transcriptional regulator [Acidimicrobiales bacterium]
MTPRHPSITFRLDPRSGVAPYRQLVDQVRQALNSGLLREGDQLPSVRDVVSQITINPNTVHRAYRELEHQGFAEGRAGLGTFITTHAEVISTTTERESLERGLRDWVSSARRAGLDEKGIAELFGATLRQDGEVLS